MSLQWDERTTLVFDETVMFGKGYDSFGLDHLSQQADGDHASYLIWPNSGKWSLYETSIGGMWFEKFDSEEEAKEMADKIERGEA